MLLLVERSDHDRIGQIGSVMGAAPDAEHEHIGPFLVIHLQVGGDEADEILEVEGGDVLVACEDDLEDNHPGKEDEEDEEKKRHFLLLVFFFVGGDRSDDLFQQGLERRFFVVWRNGFGGKRGEGGRVRRARRVGRMGRVRGGFVVDVVVAEVVHGVLAKEELQEFSSGVTELEDGYFPYICASFGV